MATLKGKIISVNISEKKGLMKKPVEEIKLIPGGIVGDAHFGSNREVSLLGIESIEAMNKLIKGKYVLKPGNFAENITTEGIVLYKLPIGATFIFKDGEGILTQIGKTCHEDCEIRKLIGMCKMPAEGVFIKVTKEGTLHPGEEFTVEY